MNSHFFDFSELGKKKDEYSSKSEQSTQTEAILKAFQQLRQKLKVQTRQINALKDDLKLSNIKSRQNEEALNATLTNNIELKEKIASLTSQNQELKKKNILMKQTVQDQANYYQEIQFTKQALLQMKTHSDMLTQQREKLIEISLAEKLAFEQEINRLKSKIQSGNDYIQQLEGNYSKCKETILKQENQIKKINISFEEEVFNKNWTKENFQTQHLLNTIKDLQKDIASLKAKNKKEKQKRVIFQDRIIELQQLSGFHNVKAQTFEGEIDMVTRKYAKLDKKYKEVKQKNQKLCSQKLEIEQNLTKMIFQNEQLVKQLKQLNNTQVNFVVQESQAKLSFLSNKRDKIQQQISNIHKSTSKLLDRTVNATTNNSPSKMSNFFSFEPHHQQTRNVLGQIRGNTQKPQRNEPKGPMYGSNMTFGDRDEESQNILIENRIRRQRQEMQRKIKEKILSRRLETSAPSDQFKLRGDYIKTFVDRKY